MLPKPVFLDVDSSIVEKNLLLTKDDPAEEDFKRLFQPEDQYPSKVIKPHPGFCIKTKELGTETKIFVNICYTDALPPSPKNLTEDELIDVWQSESASDFKIPMSIGDIRSGTDKKGNDAKIVDIAINNTFYNQVRSSVIFKQFVMAVVFEGIGNKHGLHTTDDRIILKNCKAFGTLQSHRIQQRDVQQKMQTPLEELSGSSQTIPLGNKPKIETLSSVTYDNSPEHRFFKKIGEPDILFGEFKLWNVLDAREMTLDVGEDRVILESKAKGYFLDVFVPCVIKQEAVEADFNKSSKVLTVKMKLVES